MVDTPHMVASWDGLWNTRTERRSGLSKEVVMAAGKHKVKPGTRPVMCRFTVRRTVLAVGIIVGTASIAPSAAAFEPPADPEDTFTCSNGEPVPGHPGSPGIATGVEESFVNSGGTAAAAWSGTNLFGGPLDVC
jgi:hypothetical protein